MGLQVQEDSVVGVPPSVVAAIGAYDPQPMADRNADLNRAGVRRRISRRWRGLVLRPIDDLDRQEARWLDRRIVGYGAGRGEPCVAQPCEHQVRVDVVAPSDLADRHPRHPGLTADRLLLVVTPDPALAPLRHTPGHLAWRLDSAGQTLLLAINIANHYVFSLAHPDWEVLFDADKAQAAATRRRILDMLAADRMPMLKYYMPFLGLGFVERAGEGYRFVPASYQFG